MSLIVKCKDCGNQLFFKGYKQTFYFGRIPIYECAFCEGIKFAKKSLEKAKKVIKIE